MRHSYPRTVTARNIQRETPPVPTLYLKKVWREIWSETLGELHFNHIPAGFEVGVMLVDSARMAEVNLSFLDHSGPTDVITFSGDVDFVDPDEDVVVSEWIVFGDIFICPQVAMEQSKLFGSHWIEELVRYGIHGWLHLLGYDDLSPAPRKIMKKLEDQLTARALEKYPIPKD